MSVIYVCPECGRSAKQCNAHPDGCQSGFVTSEEFARVVAAGYEVNAHTYQDYQRILQALPRIPLQEDYDRTQAEAYGNPD